MIYQKKTINNVPAKVPLSNSAPVGNPVGTIISTYKKIQPRNYLYCDGSTFDENLYPALYLYLGTNVLPDYRECAMVGAEKNTTDVFDSTETDPSTGLPGTQNHDVYTQGQFKDDQLQNHTHTLGLRNDSSTVGIYGESNFFGDFNYATQLVSSNARKGTVTRGKRKAVYYYIKAIDGVDISDEDTFLNTVKNYVDGKNSYSTDEVPTGGTWIDGKPIYRKVINFGTLPTSVEKFVPHGISNLDTFVSISGFARNSAKTIIPLPFVAADNQVRISMYGNATYIAINSNVDESSYDATIVAEYTKTTD